MSKYCTSLAAEFFVLSALNRLQQDACLTLGNAKGVDILLIRASGESVRVEVKGVAGKHDWPADNIRPNDGRLRFYVLVSFDGRIEDPATSPSVWVVPGETVERFINHYGKRCVVSRAKLSKEGSEFKGDWQSLLTKREKLNHETIDNRR
jgi:hypothetical protein